MTLFTLFYIGVVIALFFYTKRELERFKRIKYHYTYPLDHPKYYLLICLGSFAGGFVGGTFSLGNVTVIIFVLVYL